MLRKILLIIGILTISIHNTNAWVGLFADNGDIISVSRWNDMITKIHTKLDQSNIVGEGNIDVNNSGTGVIITFTGGLASSPIPDITTTVPTYMSVSSSITLSLDGDDFIPTSVVTIPGFGGSINSTNIISQSKIDLNITSNTSTGVYDIVVSNNGVLNTLWSGNGANLLHITNNINIIGDDSLGRKYTDNSYATSCNGYKNPTGAYMYYGDTGNGIYWIKPDGNPAFKVYCDMITSGGGWTRIEYTTDLTHEAQFGGGDANRRLSSDFSLTLSDIKINSIRNVSTEGKQTYHGTCQGVIHYLYQTTNYNYAFGFRFHQGHETAHNQSTYPSSNITVTSDGCESNSSTLFSTEFDIIDIRVPVINVHSRDNSSTEEFGSPLTSYPAWLR